jgi:serine/threonine protein kinase
MSPQTWQRVKSLYASALEQPAAERAEYLRQQAAEEPRVLTEALGLLKQEDSPSGRLEALQVPPGMLSGHRRGSLLAGERLNDRYEIRRFIALGGFGEVYEADDLERGERIAVKLFRPEFATADHASWLRREVRMARRVQHPNICRVFDFVQTPRAAFLTMELLDGETLAAYLRREGALSERRALPILRQIVAALSAAHQKGVIHRDLKPGNILLVPRSDGPLRVVVTDFGLARQSPLDRRTTVSMQSSTAAFGTPAYMAPEQISGRPPGPAADIYSVGVVLHEMLTGELPFASDSPLALAVRKTSEVPASPAQFAPSLRSTWVQCILRCLQPKPENRFRDVREVLTFLDARSPAILHWRLVRRALRRHSSKRNLLAAAVLAVLAASAWLVWPVRPSPQDVQLWERGLFSLHAGEPLLAIQAWQDVSPKLPRAYSDLALAWHILKLDNQARAHLAKSPSLFVHAVDRQYRHAIESLLNGDPAAALQTLRSRAAAEPANGLLLADAAYLESVLQKRPSALWDSVANLRFDHPGAHVQLAAAAAAARDEAAAERQFLTAENYFQAHAMPALVRAVASRRGLFRLANGHPDAARADLSAVTNSAIPDTGTGPCEHKLYLQAGVRDDFAAPPDPVPFISPRLKQVRLVADRPSPVAFDQGPSDTSLAVSFPLPPVRICSGQLLINIRRKPKGGGTENDFINIGAAPFDVTTFPGIQRSLWAAFADSVKGGLSIEITAETFANIQRSYAEEPQAYLDILSADDTDFDFITLLLVY